MILAGIYEILGPDDCIYVGSSMNLRLRLNAHRLALIRGDHHSRKMQAACNEYGIGAFQFNILAVVKDDDLRLGLEQDLLTWLFSTKNRESIYNTSDTVGHYRQTGPRRRSVPRLIIRSKNRKFAMKGIL